MSFVENICFNNVIDWFLTYMQTVWTQIRLLHVWQSGLFPLQFGKDQNAKVNDKADDLSQDLQWECKSIQSNLGYPNADYPKLLGYSKTMDSPEFFLYYLLQ